MFINRELRDMFVDKKSIHVKLKPDIHAKLRTELFNYNLTMQDIFDGFARLVANNDKRALKILESLSRQKIEQTIIKSENKEKNNKFDEKKYYFSELEEDAMYNLIKGSKENEPDEDDENG
jgi:hypothetical protein